MPGGRSGFCSWHQYDANGYNCNEWVRRRERLCVNIALHLLYICGVPTYATARDEQTARGRQLGLSAHSMDSFVKDKCRVQRQTASTLQENPTK